MTLLAQIFTCPATSTWRGTTSSTAGPESVGGKIDDALANLHILREHVQRMEDAMKSPSRRGADAMLAPGACFVDPVSTICAEPLPPSPPWRLDGWSAACGALIAGLLFALVLRKVAR